MDPADSGTAVAGEDVDLDDDARTLAERVLPDSALGRWGIYLVIVAAVAAILWFWVFPWLQHLLPEGF